MKKFLRTGKKALSVFMAVMMVLTAWVFFEPMEAGAVSSSGSYTWRLYINCTNAYTGNGYYTVTGKTNNGTGNDTTVASEVNLDVGSNSIFDKGGSGYFPSESGTTSAYFPYKVYIHTYKDSGLTWWPGITDGQYSAELQVKKGTTWNTICSGTSPKNSGHTNIDLTISNTSNNFPTPTTISWVTESTADTADLVIDKNNNVTRTMKFNVFDQYGVRMSSSALTSLGKEPKASVTGSQSGTIGTSTSSNIYYSLSSSNTDAYYITITAKPAAKSTTYDSQTITVGASCNGKSLTNRSFTLYDPMYTFTMNPNGGGMITPTSNVSKRYHNTFGYTPNASRTGFSLIGFYTTDYEDSYESSKVPSGTNNLDSSTYIDSDLTWYAAWQARSFELNFKYPNSNTVYSLNDHKSMVYYDRAISAPSVPQTVPQTVNVGVDYTYTFTGWNPSVPSKMPASNATYTAQYSQTIHYANLSALNTAITNAKAIYDAGNPENAYHETQYTAESWATFVQVYNNAVTMKNQNSGNGPLLSAQQSVDEMAALLNSTRPVKSKITVVFVDEDGAIIKDGFHLVDYGTTVTAPANPTKDPDATYHYTFNSWASTDSDSLSDLNPVTHNLKFVAKFTKTAHTFTTTTASGCHGDTITTKTCSTCGYSETTASDVTLHTWSTDYKTISPANCSTVGKEAKYCTECGAYDASSVRDIAKTSHSFSAWTNYQAATCGAQGVQTRTCANCGQLEVQKTAATGSHTYETKHTCAATCTADGYTVKVCSVCGNTTITTTTKLGHNLTTTTTQAATCASVGVKETKCTRCDYGKTEIIPTTGTHSYGVWTTISTANCISKGVKTRECSVCGKVETEITNETAHSWGAWTEVTPATCTGKGVQKRTCPTCRQSETQETTALGHNFVQSAVVPATCEAGGYTLNVCDRSGCGAQQITNKTTALGHGWTTKDHAADCTHSAYTEYKCANDASHNYNKYDETKPALGHDFTGTATVTKAATCTEDGTKTIACTRCSEVQTVTIPKLGHNYTAGAAQAPSCTTSGYTPYTCSRCRDTYNVYDDSKPATGHTWGDWVVTKAPTETTDGEQTRTCSVCGATETAPVPATSHTLVEDTTKTVAPTCTTDGQKVYKCTATHPGQSGACTYTVTEVVPKLGHNLSTTKTDATCTVDGKVITSCSRCDYKAETVIPATGHSYTNAVTTQPTCTTAGVRTYTCQHDSTHTYTEAIEKLPHNFVAGTPVAATCTESGYTPYKCENCDEAYVKITASATGHNYAEVDGSSTATCTAAGTKTLKCAACDSTITVAVPALGHDYQKTASTTATCAAAATETYKCSRCDASYTISVGDKTTAHDWNEWTVVEKATYDSLGYKTRDCKVCGKLEVETIPCLGDHVFDNETGRQDATCTEDGYIDYACSAHTDCGKVSRVLLPKTGHDLTTATTAAGCTTEGKVVTSCSKCDYKIETAIPATGHAWGAGKVTKQPTCTAEGEMEYTCPVCLATKTEKIATNPNAHVYTAGAVTAATCVTPELTTYSCACGKSEIMQTAAANGHSWNAEKTVDKAATCIDAGSKSTHCANCEATKDAEVIPPTGHSLKTQKVDPTCTKGGYTAEVCEICRYLDSVTAVDPLGHDYKVTNTTAATCTKGAIETKTCKRNGCAETVTTITSNPTGHNWGDWYISKPATETTKGEKKRQCRNNTNHFETCEIPTIGHKWDSGTVEKAATCYEVGTMLYTCTGCENCVKAGTMATIEVEIPKTEHTYTQVTTPATCTADGTTVVKCSVAECGYVAQTVTLPATGHTLERDTAKDVAPTCTTEGSFAYKCKNCEYTETITRDALGHDYSTTAVTVTDPTCTTDGVKAYKCTRCDAQIETAIPKTGHDFSITEVIAPTCTDKGYTIKKCANCTENYVVSDSFVDAAGHNWGTGIEIQAPTTDGYGIMKYVCLKCGAERLETIAPIGDHVFTLQSEVKPGCETTGEKVWVCTAHTDCPANYTEIVPATGHNMKAVQTAATCTTPPYQTWTCDNGCGHSYIVVTGTATGHNYTKTTTAATCEADGNEHYVCGNCGHEYDVVLPKLGHNYTTVVTDPTCSAYGYTTYTCQNDPTHTYKSDFVATTAHTYAKDDAQSVAATCESKGYDVMVCSGCGDSYKVITDATGHAYDAGVVTTLATCTANGVKTFTCANCGDTYTEVIPATGHTYGEGVVDREANDGNSGLIAYTCSKCNDKFYEEYVINSTEHTWNVEVKQNPTCTEKGLSAYTCINPSCDVCSHGVKAKFTKQTAALGHNYVGVETTAPTCTEKGVMTYTCSRCSDSYTEDIPATGHNPKKVKDVPATCISAGYTEYVCDHVDADGNKCGYTMYDNYIAPLTHDLKVDVIAPTCIAAGYTLATCQRADCGYTNITNVTEATGHDYDSAVTTEPTCEADGVMTYTCKTCAADVDGHSYTETVAKTGHAWGKWVITKYPTATAEGEKTRTCANVNCPIQTETVTLPKLGHTMVAGDIKVQPTCTTTGVQEYVCTEHTGDAACGYTYEVTLPALGHDWDDGEITTAAICTADGEKTYTCKRTDCGAVKTEVVPKTGHDMETAVTEATCISDKFTTYTCKTCGYAYVINETGTALGHTFSVVVETVDATCEAKGYTIYKCERCEQTKTETTQAIGHDWGEWKTTTPATCEERGVETRVCKNNPNHIQTRRTNTVDHDFVSTLYHPTCTESGFTILACKGCGKTIRTDFVPAYGHKYDEGVYEDATCTTPGGIRYTCTNTNPDGTPCGHSYLVKDTEPLGHTWGKWHYVEHPTVEDAYAKQRDCTRGTCTAIEYERGKMSNEDDINVYYKVEFYNPWTTDTCYELNNGRTKLAKTYKTTKVNEGYYLAGTEATYPSSVLPKRDKDYTWGAYKLIDWTYDEVGQTDSALNDMKSITKNMAVYANFEGYDVYYKVRFWSGSDPLTIEQVILHGHSAQYPFDNPTKADNLHYKYEFTGWDYDYTAIYDSVGINALYNEIPKTYTMVYCDWNGDELAREDFQYGDPAKKNPTNLERPENATYIYQFSGKWQTQPGKEQFIELSSLTVPLGTKEGDEVKVYAKYYQKAKSYVVNIYGYGINKELIPGATVQIYNSNGQIVTTTKLDEESKAIITLNYDTTYQIVITDDVGNVGKGDIELNTTMKDENGKLVPTMTTIYLKQYEDPDHGGSNCHCICHSFLGGFWISILNMIYRLFGRKIVCCYDMFATHGDRLIYGK